MRSYSDAVAATTGNAYEIAEPAFSSDRRIDPLERFAEIIVVLALLGELVAMFGNVVCRALFNNSLLWSLEVSELSLVVMTFVGGAIAYPRDQHMSLQALVQRLPLNWQPAIDALACWQVFATSFLGGWLSWQMMLSRWTDRTAYLGLRTIWFAIPMIFGMALLAYFSAGRAFRQPRRIAVATGLALALVLAAALAVWFALGVQLRDYALPVTFLVFAVQCLLGVPIGFVLLVGSAAYLATSHTVPLSVIPINMQAGISSFVMLAIPFFILAGYVMTEGGLSRRLMDFVILLVDRFRGGMLQVIVVTMYIMSGISGSKLADVAAVATTMKTVMRGEGYEVGETAAVLSACAVMGETVPPSIAMLVLASVTTLSIGSLFVAGLLPAAVIALCLMALIWFRSRGRSVRARKHSPREVFRAGPDRHSRAGRAGHPDRRHRQRNRDADGSFLDRGGVCAGAFGTLLPFAWPEPISARCQRHGFASRNGTVHHEHGHRVLVVADHREDAAADRGIPPHAAWLGDAVHAGHDRDPRRHGRFAGRSAGAADFRPAVPADRRRVRHRSAAIRYRADHLDGAGCLLSPDRRRHVRHLRHLRH